MIFEQVILMSVLKNLRGLSEMEFYKNALKIRKDITEWLLKDFGYRKNPRSIHCVVKGMTPDEQSQIDAIFAVHGKSPGKEFQSEFPSWFVDFERQVIIRILHDMMSDITRANSVYATLDFEFDLRRKYQDMAITCCYELYQELSYIRQSFRINLNKWLPVLDGIDREVNLLRGWRQSDNKRRKELKSNGVRLVKFAVASAVYFCNANNNGNANYNRAGNANGYVRPRFEWRAKRLGATRALQRKPYPIRKENQAQDAAGYVRCG